MKSRSDMRAVHPCEVFRQEADEPGILVRALQEVPSDAVNRGPAVLDDLCDDSADAALRLARDFGTTLLFWMNPEKTRALLQSQIAFEHPIDGEVTPRQSAA